MIPGGFGLKATQSKMAAINLRVPHGLKIFSLVLPQKRT
jgi:hypothetical protein